MVDYDNCYCCIVVAVVVGDHVVVGIFDAVVVVKQDFVDLVAVVVVVVDCIGHYDYY